MWLQWELFILTGQKPLLLKLEGMFMVMLAESQPVSLPLGTEDEKPLLFFPLKWALFTEDATEIQKQSHWSSCSRQVSRMALAFPGSSTTCLHEEPLAWVFLPRLRGHTPSSRPVTASLCPALNNSIAPTLLAIAVVQIALFTCIFNYEWAFACSEKAIALIQ